MEEQAFFKKFKTEDEIDRILASSISLIENIVDSRLLNAMLCI